MVAIADADVRSAGAEKLLLGATFVTWLGNSIHLTATALLLIETGTAMSVGWLMIAVAAPQALLSAAFGRVADRVDRRLLCVWCDLASAVIAFALPVSLALGAPPAQTAYLTTFLLTAIFGMYLPAVSAMTKERVAAGRLPRFNANFEIAVQTGTLLSASIGGFAVQAFGTGSVFVFNAATYLVSAACLAAMGHHRTQLSTVDIHTVDNLAGQPKPVGRIAILYALGTGILTVTNTLIVVLVVRTFGQGAGVLGVIDALAGVGVLAGVALYKRATRRFDQLTIATAGYLGCAVFLYLNPRLGIVALAFLYPAAAACFGMARVAARTMLMNATTERNVGRVFGAANAAGLAFSVAVTLLITRIADTASVSAGYLTLALTVAAVAAVGANLIRKDVS
jgi:MFS family permease